MKNLDLSRYVLNCAAVALLSGCGGSPSPIGALGAIPQSRAISTHADRGRSWMLPEAKSEDLLYIANNEMLTVYSYPSAKLVGILRPHLNPRPLTECSDKAGDVFVTDRDDVYVWVHGRIKPLRTLTFYGASAVACSSDPTTGNLAVTYQMGSTGYVAVYKKAKGTPTLYQDGNLNFAFCGYDPNGNLFADGTYGSSANFGFAELPKGGDQLGTITLNQSFRSPGTVQWDGKYVTVGDNTLQIIYRFTISGSQGTLVGTTYLTGPAGRVLQWWIKGNMVVSGSWFPNKVYFWNYPTGGKPVNMVARGLQYPDGVTVSVARK